VQRLRAQRRSCGARLRPSPRRCRPPRRPPLPTSDRSLRAQRRKVRAAWKISAERGRKAIKAAAGCSPNPAG
jgi:hypothetical protein